MQLKLGLIPPNYKDSRLYIDLIYFNKNRSWKDTGIRKLVFYDTDNQSEHIKTHEIAEIDFPNFNSAYRFILDHNIKNFNIDSGCYKKEIKEFERTLDNEIQN